MTVLKSKLSSANFIKKLSADGRILLIACPSDFKVGTNINSSNLIVLGELHVTGTSRFSNGIFSSGLTGSITKLPDGTDFLDAGTNITIITGSNGMLTISSITNSGDITGVTAGTGLSGGGTSGDVTLTVDDSVVATLTGSQFTGQVGFQDNVSVTGSLTAAGPALFNSGLSGSLAQLPDGTAYIEAGTGISISTGSDGKLTMTADGSDSPAAGSNNQVQFNNAGILGASTNLWFGSSGLYVTGAITISGKSTLGATSADTATINAQTIVLANVAAGTDNTVLVYNGSSIVTDEIDSKVWAGDLVDYTGTPADNELAVWTDTDTVEGDSNLTWNGSTLDVVGGLKIDGNSTLGATSGDTVTINGITAGTDNSVVVIDGSGVLKHDEIDSKVWDSKLIDYTGTPANNELAVWTDTDTVEGDSNLTFDGSTLDVGGDVDIASGQYLRTNGIAAVGSSGNEVQFGSSDDDKTLALRTDVGTVLSIDAAGVVTFDVAPPTGTDNTVLVINSSNEIVRDEIDPRVWGTTLVDGTNGTNNEIPTFTDSNSITGESSLTYDGSLLTIGDGNYTDGETILKLNTDRAWTFKQSGNSSSANLMLQNTTGPNKHFIIQTNGETRFYNAAGTEKLYIDNLTGDLDADGTKNFNIAHPLKSDYRLRHTSIEGPLCDLIYRGKITLDGNEGLVDIDSQFGMTTGTFTALTKNPQVFLQNSTGWAPARVKSFSEGILTIESQSADSDEVCWMVVATRKDAGVMGSHATDENGDLIVEFKTPVDETSDPDEESG